MNQYLNGLAKEPFFDKATLFRIVQSTRPHISSSTFYRIIKKMLADGEIIRVGRDAYCVPQHKLCPYSHEYLELAKDLAEYILAHYPNLDFRIFETVQLNSFLNHPIRHNTIFLSVEGDLGNFLFDELRDRYNNNVLIYPTAGIFHRYWKEDVIVICKLPTESPKGGEKFWHTRLEKLLVDIMADKLIKDTFSESEYPLIYETAFSGYVVDESQMFRYARRRSADQKILDFLRENTTVTLKTVKN